MSQMGAFIRTEEWSSFQINNKTILTCFLPPDFSGQDEFMALQGEATVRRLDPANKCVAVEFVKSFRQFERCVDDSTRMGQQDDRRASPEGEADGGQAW
jgi:hypothetical protein